MSSSPLGFCLFPLGRFRLGRSLPDREKTPAWLDPKTSPPDTLALILPLMGAKPLLPWSPDNRAGAALRRCAELRRPHQSGQLRRPRSWQASKAEQQFPVLGPAAKTLSGRRPERDDDVCIVMGSFSFYTKFYNFRPPLFLPFVAHMLSFAFTLHSRCLIDFQIRNAGLAFWVSQLREECLTRRWTERRRTQSACVSPLSALLNIRAVDHPWRDCCHGSALTMGGGGLNFLPLFNSISTAFRGALGRNKLRRVFFFFLF